MPGQWEGSSRRAELPPDWYTTIRPRILDRDGHRCRWVLTDGRRCPQVATEVDHIRDRHDHRDQNLQALCEWHHNRKSSAEGNSARRRFSNRRPPEQHPGLL